MLSLLQVVGLQLMVSVMINRRGHALGLLHIVSSCQERIKVGRLLY